MLINQLHTLGAGIRALYDYDNTIFDDMQTPEGFTKEEIMNRIFFKYGDTPLYVFNPEIMKFYIKEWSARLLPLWERYAAAVALEYDPIENYNRTEKREFTHGKKVSYSGTITDGTSGKIVDTPSGTITDSVNTTTTNELSADNSSTYVGDNKTTVDGKANERTYTNYKEEKSFEQYQEQKTFNNSDQNSGKDVEDLHVYGNIGTITSQSMLASELDLIPRLDTLDFIVDSFKTEFCLYVY